MIAGNVPCFLSVKYKLADYGNVMCQEGSEWIVLKNMNATGRCNSLAVSTLKGE